MIFKQAYIPWLMYKIVCFLSFEDRGWAEWIFSFDFVRLNCYDFFSKQLDVYLDEKYDQLFLRFGTYPTWPWKPSPGQTRMFWRKIEDFQFVVSTLWLWYPSNWNGKNNISFEKIRKKKPSNIILKKSQKVFKSEFSSWKVFLKTFQPCKIFEQ